jgi:hypothetical protein
MDISTYLNGTCLISIFELNMKSDEVIDLLECFDMDVVYRFDRLCEGTPDRYAAAARSEGVELQFDERQVLETIWCYIVGRDGFSPIDSSCIGVFIPSSITEAQNYAVSTEQQFTKTDTWFRLECSEMWIHYEFIESKLSLITIMRPWQ